MTGKSQPEWDKRRAIRRVAGAQGWAVALLALLWPFLGALKVSGQDSEAVGALVREAGGWGFAARHGALAELVRQAGRADPGYARAVVAVLFSLPSLVYTVAVLVVGAGVLWIPVKMADLRREPGPAGWVACGNLWATWVLYPEAVSVEAPMNSAVFLGLALAPGLAALGGGLAWGMFQWSRARRRMQGCVCRHHFQRLVPGPRLGWLERWTGRQWVRHRGGRGGVEGLVGDTVCRGHGCGDRYEEVERVVAVLDARPPTPLPRGEGGVLRVDWLRYRKPFDFEGVEIEEATAREVEEFVVQSRYQAEEKVQRGLGRMECVVGSRARLEEPTLRVLTPVFGKVTRRSGP